MASKLHIGVLAFPFGTHAAPLLTLVRRLSASAPHIQFSFFNTSASNKTVFSSDHASSNNSVRAYDVWDGTPEGVPFSGNHFEAMGLFINASPGNFEKAIGVAEDETGLKICCLISDAFLWFASDLAEKRGVPWIAFWTAGSCSLAAHVYTDEIRSVAGSEDSAEKALTFIPGLSMVHIGDVPHEVFYDKNPSPLAMLIYNMVQKISKSTAVVLNSFEEIDPLITNDLKTKFQHFLSVGPSILSSPCLPGPDDEAGCLSWLEAQTRQESVIYISFGTVISPPENEIVALAKALETCGFPFLWSMRDLAKKSLPEGFLERTSGFGKVVPWAPQLQVLATSSVGLFVTHCGWNSVLESISNGVPMVCRPFFGDQKLNGRMVEDVWRIGVRVKGGVFAESETIEALNQVMLSGAIRENVRKLRMKAESAVKSEGSSCKNFKTLLEIVSAQEDT